MIWCWFWNLILTRPDSLSLTLFLKIPVGGSFKRIEIFFWTFICLSSKSTCYCVLCRIWQRNWSWSQRTSECRPTPESETGQSARIDRRTNKTRSSWQGLKLKPLQTWMTVSILLLVQSWSFWRSTSHKNVCIDSLLVKISLLAPQVLLEHLWPMITIPIPSHPVRHTAGGLLQSQLFLRKWFCLK